MIPTHDFRDVTASELQTIDGGTATLDDLKTFFEVLSNVLKANSETVRNIASNIR